MSPYKTATWIFHFGILALACVAEISNAASPPDAGRVLETVQPPPSPAPLKSVSPPDVQSPVKPAIADPSLQVTVKTFRIVGATVYREQDLLVLLQPFQDQSLGLTDLEQAAATITRFYRKNGYLVARAYVPAQEIKQGVVEIAILEGHVGRVALQMKNADARLRQTAAENMLGGAIKQDDLVEEAPIERGLLLLNDLPGMEVKSTLVPGASVGMSDLIVEAYEKYWINGSVDADNFGNRYTDRNRIGGSVNLDNPVGVGDRLSLRALTSGSRMNYGRLSYLLPVGDQGTKFGTAYSRVDYKLGHELAALEASGDADVSNLFVLHPFQRTRRFSLFGTVGFDHKDFTNRANGTVTSDKTDDLLSLGLSGESRDDKGGGGINNFEATLVRGRLDLSGAPADQTADATTAQTNGGFSKVDYRAARLQRVTEEISFYAAWQGQRASTNLDSSEKFVLGGPLGVRAYPQGEAAGDEADVLNLELRWDTTSAWAPGYFQWAGFVDAGRVRMHKDLWNGWQGGNARLPNGYVLYGSGIALTWSMPSRYQLRASYAHKLGHNPGRDSNNHDSDNTDDSGRFWVQASAWF